VNSKIQVLHVDDDPSFLRLSKAYLQTLDSNDPEIDIIGETLPTKALKTLKRNHNFDVIVCDYQMPILSGIELLEKIRQFDDTIPFIMFTGKGKEEVVIQALNAGADFYLEKGINPKPIFIELRHVIENLYSQKMIKRDLVASKRKVKLTERRFKEIVDNISDLISILDSHGRVLYDNPAVEETLGYSLEERLNSDSMDYFHPEDRERVMLKFEKILKQPNKTFIINYRYLTKSGGYRILESKAKNLLHNEAINGILIISYDISKRLALRNALKLEKECKNFKDEVLS